MAAGDTTVGSRPRWIVEAAPPAVYRRPKWKNQTLEVNGERGGTQSARRQAVAATRKVLTKWSRWQLSLAVSQG